MIKTACKNSEKYTGYDYFKKAYKHDAEHVVAKHVTILRIVNYCDSPLSVSVCVCA